MAWPPEAVRLEGFGKSSARLSSSGRQRRRRSGHYGNRAVGVRRTASAAQFGVCRNGAPYFGPAFFALAYRGIRADGFHRNTMNTPFDAIRSLPSSLPVRSVLPIVAALRRSPVP